MQISKQSRMMMHCDGLYGHWNARVLFLPGWSLCCCGSFLDGVNRNIQSTWNMICNSFFSSLLMSGISGLRSCWDKAAVSITMLCCVLSPLQALPMTDSVMAREGARVIWDFEKDIEEWGMPKMITSLTAYNGCLRGTANGGDPYVTSPLLVEKSLRNTAGVVVRIHMSATAQLELFWQNENGGFASVRRSVQMVPGQEWTTVVFDLRGNPEWSGKTISRLRLDPGTVGVTFAIDYVAAVDHMQQSDVSWLTQANNFEMSADGWTAPKHVSNFLWEEGKLKGRTTGNDPNLLGPTISVTGQAGVMTQFKAAVDCEVKLYWTTTEGGFAESRSSVVSYRNTGGWQLLKFDLRNHPQWAGKTVTRLRLDPATESSVSFELDAVFIAGAAGFADDDGDLLDGMSELAFGSDPAQRSELQGRRSQERWNDLFYYSTNTLVADRGFYSKPVMVRYDHPDASDPFYTGVYYATRSRSWLTAPATGTYRFWISGRNGLQLLLSTDDTKYTKRVIAQLNPELGTGHGILSDSTNLWDVYSTQMSREIHLTAGQRYYLETIQVNGHGVKPHCTVAWAPPGKGRTVLELAHLQSYAPTADDLDDDCLPDAWEIQYGLSAMDSGLNDLVHEGERGDFDGDGLSNLEEYVLGSDPSDSDTDGDGISDFDEVSALGTDALTANAITDTLLSQLDLSSYISSSTAWTMTSGGLVADSFRGEATWNFTVPTDGHWLLRLELELMGATYGNEEVPIVIKVDGQIVVRKLVRFGTGKRGLLQALTPWLLSGNHQVSVLVDNSLARRTVRLGSLKIQAPANAAATLAQDNRVLPHAAATRTSPAFLEGYARDPGSVTINSNVALTGSGRGHWYANIPLSNLSETQSYTIGYEQGWQATGSITWQATNAMDAETLTIRRGDSLRVGAWATDLTMTSTVTLSSGGTTALTGMETTVLAFPTAGVFTVTGNLANGSQAVLTVRVIAPPGFSGQTLDTLDNFVRSISVSAASEVAFEIPSDLARLTVTRSGSTAHLAMAPLAPEAMGVVSRLLPGGPILAVQQLNVIGVSDALQNDLTTASSSAIPGYKILHTPLTVLNLPEGAWLEVNIFRAGVMFLNGSTTMKIVPADLINGSMFLQFLYPLGMPGGYCHTVKVYDRNGLFLGSR